MNRRSSNMGRSHRVSIKKRIAAAIVAAALVVGAAGPVVSAPAQDDASETVAASNFKYSGGFSGASYRYGGSWS